MNIVVDTDVINSQAQDILNYAQSLNDDISRLNSTIDSLSSSWEGDDATKYINTMRDVYLSDLQKLSEIVTEYGEYLRGAAEAYSNIDDKFSSRSIDV